MLDAWCLMLGVVRRWTMEQSVLSPALPFSFVLGRLSLICVIFFIGASLPS